MAAGRKLFITTQASIIKDVFWEKFCLSRGLAVMTAPNAEERKACWNARDHLWKCLDDNYDKAESCQKFQREFEANCPAQ
uniref:cytochrome c oxidase assembly factor 6 homolog isoform X2 n=1 Tax=Scatophagus argus TaxID=75038 RepID=UPI001ED81F20|nr:cytochrome c oxidase assembly factor 6 homolog isoform X2 [Scatophagus argus]